MEDPTATGIAPSFNISLNLSSLFSLPSRFLARIRKIDDMLNQDLENHAIATAAAATPANRLQEKSVQNMPYELVAMPGPLGFLTSGYAVGLLVMTLLLNRIQHIVVPPRRSLAMRVMHGRRSLLRAFFYSLFPIDLSTTVYRLGFRIPSLFLLFKSLILFSVILLEVCGFYPSWNIYVVREVGQWAADKEMSEVCWGTFCAVCLSLVIGSLTRGLEGASVHNNGSPFNLFGYAMLLHIYSVPLTHPIRGPPSRPDKNVLITILLPLLQLTMIHFLGIKKRWSKQRLVPTTLCSLLTLLHFNIVLFTKPSTYPLLNYLPSLLETILLLVTLLTCALNAFTQLVLEGEIRRPFFGHTRSLAPKWDEDFSVVLLRLGTASLEATNVAGLGNELGAVAVSDARATPSASAEEDGLVELNSAGVVSITRSKKGRRRAGGFSNEIKNVKVNANESDWLIDHAWLREFVRFGLSLLSVVKGISRLFLWIVWYRWRGAHFIRPANSREGDEKPRGRSRTRERSIMPNFRPEAQDDYSRFLKGESVSDDEDDYLPPHERRDGDSSMSDSDGSNSEVDEGSEVDEVDGDGQETANLYTDLMVSHATQASAPVLLAHMVAPSSSPLTRRRYNQLVTLDRASTAPPGPDSTGDLWSEFIKTRRGQSSQITVDQSTSSESVLDGGRCCVICTTEPRDIICWPCRCLAICDDCRENLASRFAASKHSCPCCRRSVEGYSRIYLP